jgi:hypothetical protein
MKIKLSLLLMAFVLTGCPFDETEKCVEAQIKAEQFTVCKDLKGEDEDRCKKVMAISAEATGRLLCLKAKAGS